MGFIREDELISRGLKTCENCEWCIPIIEKYKKFEIEVPRCLLKGKQRAFQKENRNAHKYVERGKYNGT